MCPLTVFVAIPANKIIGEAVHCRIIDWSQDEAFIYGVLKIMPNINEIKMPVSRPESIVSALVYHKENIGTGATGEIQSPSDFFRECGGLIRHTNGA